MLPAYAGMILARNPRRSRACGAPRVCGDDPCALLIPDSGVHVLPAYAGMIPGDQVGDVVAYSAPRVCGDDPAWRSFTTMAAECSPRMRG